MPARQYLLQALPIALEVLNVYSEAQREGYLTPHFRRTHPVVKVRARSIHRIADKEGSRKPIEA